MNSNFEGWFLQNQDKSYRDFEFTFNKMSTSGSLFDLEKLIVSDFMKKDKFITLLLLQCYV